MRRLPLLLVAGALWLFLAAVPALADGGPHVMDVNNGTLGLNADSCAGCHRVHTAQGPLLLKAADETTLCLSCHGAAVTGATTDVMSGVQYQLSGTPGAPRDAAMLGALRGGGYSEARIGDPARIAVTSPFGSGVGQRSEVAVGAAEAVTSAHIDLDGAGGVVAQDIAWGNGQNGSGAGPTVELSCVACHNPHGNGQYRILRPVPHLAGSVEADAVTYPILTNTGSTVKLVSSTADFTIGVDTVTITGNSSIPDGDYTVTALGSSNTVVTLSGGPWADGTGGTLQRTSGMLVDDGTLPAAGEVRNYTVIARNSSPLLYASDVLAGGTRGETIGISSSDSTTEVITTASAHGLTVGDTVDVINHDGAGANGTGLTVATVPSATEFTLTGVDITTDGTDFGWVLHEDVVGSYATTDGAYFHRYGSTALNATSYTGPGVDSPIIGGTDDTFNGQMTAWCSACHSRYYAWQQPTDAANLVSVDTAGLFTTEADHGFVATDVVIISDVVGSAPVLNGYSCTVATVPNPDEFTCTGLVVTTAGTGGSAVPTTTGLGANYNTASPGDDIYKFQHRTRTNRACTTCHVAHGSNVAMDGGYSSTFTYPDGTASASSRLLKVDNRGTCQLCHDPTETVEIGQWVSLPGTYIP